jgi:hypothetical protein
MSKLPGCAIAAAAVVVAGCATGNGEAPLIFGTTNVYGVSIGGNVSETAGEFLVGYKGFDLAVIPVSAVESGSEQFIGASTPGGGQRDSYSVIGQFNADAGRKGKGASAGLGKFFATGAAAHNIARGFARKMGVGRTSVAQCASATPPAAVPAGGAGAGESKRVAEAAKAESPASSSAPSGTRTGARLIFAQYDYMALAVDGSALDAGAKFTFGARDRNVAVIPLFGRDAGGRLVPLESHNPGSGEDVLSVLGQFQANAKAQFEASRDPNGTTKTAASDASAPAPQQEISSGLEKFFSTGAAATILSEGFKVKLCEEYVASEQPPAPLAPAQGNQQETKAVAPHTAKVVTP